MKKSIISLAIFSILFATTSAFADQCPNVVKNENGTYQITFKYKSFALNRIIPGLDSRYNPGDAPGDASATIFTRPGDTNQINFGAFEISDIGLCLYAYGDGNVITLQMKEKNISIDLENCTETSKSETNYYYRCKSSQQGSSEGAVLTINTTPNYNSIYCQPDRNVTDTSVCSFTLK